LFCRLKSFASDKLNVFKQGMSFQCHVYYLFWSISWCSWWVSLIRIINLCIIQSSE